jgi:hypothetical protein
LEAELLRAIGEPKTVAEGIRAFGQDAKVFAANSAEMLRAYRNHWVALEGSEVKASARTLKELLAKADVLGVSRPSLTVRFVSPAKKTLIL